MDLFSSSDIQHLPQSVISIRSKNGLNATSSAGSTPVVEFEIPSSLGFYLAEDVVFSFDFKYESDVVYNLRPQQAGGMGGMIRQIDIYSIQDGVLLESINDYHILNSVLMTHMVGADDEVQSGEFKKLSLTEGLTLDNSNITPYTTYADPYGKAQVVADPLYQSQKIQLPLRLSHLLSASQVIPVSAIGGLRIRIQLNRPEVFNILSGSDIDGKCVIDGNATLKASNTQIDIVAGVNDTLNVDGVDKVFPDGDYKFNNGNTELVDFLNGIVADPDLLFSNAVVDDATNEVIITLTNSGAGDKVLGGNFFTSFSNSPPLPYTLVAGTDIVLRFAPAVVKIFSFLLKPSYNLNNPKSQKTCPIYEKTSVVYQGQVIPVSRISNINTNFALDTTGVFLTLTPDDSVVKTTITSPVEYSLKNIALNVPIITPPPAYVKSLVSAVSSAEGMKMDIKTYSLVRNSAQKGQTLSTFHLPFVSTKARGIISIPHIVEAGSILSRNCCNTLEAVQPSKYHYEYMGVKHPERSIDCEKANNKSLSQELIVEQQKAFEYCLGKLGSLDGYKDGYKTKSWFVGRNLGVFGSVMDTRDANIALTIESDNGILSNSGSSTLNFNHYCSSVDTLVMKAEGVMRMR
jgi:hypothetical protein